MYTFYQDYTPMNRKSLNFFSLFVSSIFSSVHHRRVCRPPMSDPWDIEKRSYFSVNMIHWVIEKGCFSGNFPLSCINTSISGQYQHLAKGSKKQNESDTSCKSASASASVPCGDRCNLLGADILSVKHKGDDMGARLLNLLIFINNVDKTRRR